MWTTAALLASALALTPGQPPAGGLTLSNPRATHGELGSVRQDAKLLPGDIFFLSFDIEGVKVTDTGRVKYGMVMEVIDSAGKAIFKQQPVERDDFLPLGGNKLPARAYVSIGVDQPAGIYTCKVTVSDLANKDKPVTKTLEQKFEVLPKNFGIVQLYTAADLKGDVPASLVGVAGQFVFVHFALIGFDRKDFEAPAPKAVDPKAPAPKAPAPMKQPNLTIKMVVYDKDSKPTLATATEKLIPDEADGYVDEKAVGVPMRFLVPMNREGGYLIEIMATDNVSKKTAKVYLPLRVFPAGQ